MPNMTASLYLCLKIVSHAPFCMYVFGFAGICLYLLSQSPYMYVHSPHIAGVFVTPHNIQQILPAVNLVWIKDQKLQHVKFFGGEIDLFPMDKYSPALAVQL